ncbi:MAG: D-3-phosphoglycerate dehydrogenase / 2-oxoglutarate reductase [Thermodesulfobacteriota bacterium]|nr:D-3-phosphoglycerate dehydrogenase / 2-oxoglutarate reductase [Thermodesulfobacteriota bacterium]
MRTAHKRIVDSGCSRLAFVMKVRSSMKNARNKGEVVVKVLVSDNLSELGVKIFREAEGIEVDVKVGLSPDELKQVIRDYDGLAVRGATKVTEEVIAVAEKLKVIGRAGTGLDNVNIPAASKRGIVVMNTPGGNTVTTAEHAVTMMMSLARNIPQADYSMKQGKWEKKKFSGTEIFNKTLGIIGLGKIGSVVADRAMGLGMTILAYDPFLSEDQAKQMGIRLGNLDTVFAEADFITLHVPLTDDTRGLINAQNIAKMKDGVRIVNCSRGPVVNEEDLADAIESGKVAGAALDVYSTEPPGLTRLITLDRVICTPHLGASTQEAQDNVAVAVAAQIRDYLLYGTIRNAVNAPAVSGEALERLKPYLDLAERLGLFLGQTIQTGIKSVEAQYCGDVSEMELKPITTTFLTGLLTPIMKEDVNQVNAPMVAEERGIVVSETKVKKSENFISLLRYKVVTERKDHVVEGTLFGKSEPRMVRYGSFRGEFDLSGELVLVHALDKPGVIGKVGATLGDKGINISHLQFARQREGGEALLFLNTDAKPGLEVMDALAKLDHVSWVKRLTI